MRKVRCYECGKSYDFDEDDFCPKCGAFNQPPRETRIGADGTLVRVDGLNERNHKGSFVHRELHEENRERRAIGLSKGVKRGRSQPAASSVRKPKKQETKNPLAIVGKIIFWIIILNVFATILEIIF